MRKYAIALLSLLAFAIPTGAVTNEELTRRVLELEKRLAALEESLRPVIEEAELQQVVGRQRAAARARFREDRERYSDEELRKIEELYQSANKNLRSEEAKGILEELVSQYDRANRTGCAVLYLGQQTDGDEQIKHLKQAIDQFGDCYYGDGVQVGPYARYYLAMRYKRDGNAEQANALFDGILEAYPEALTHRGELLSSAIAAER